MVDQYVHYAWVIVAGLSGWVVGVMMVCHAWAQEQKK